MSANPEELEAGELKGEEASSSGEVCVSCGIAVVDDIKLTDCNAGCDLVKYCGDNCQVNHREQHEKECKKRLTEMHDKQLFTQPDISHHGECPICCLPLPIDPKKSIMMTCCSKLICSGCDHANYKREFEQGLQHRCAFCRNPAPKSEEQALKQIMKRIKKNNDPAAMCRMGTKHYSKGDYGKALQYYAKAAELGDVRARSCLGGLYYSGEGVEKDEEKAVYHWEQAAIDGHPGARVYLAAHEMENGRLERAAKHWIIAANLGCDTSLKAIKVLFVKGVVSKEEYAGALRGQQAFVDATKSAEREKVEASKSFHDRKSIKDFSWRR
jgi:tetratricopeptide (TPR) repeat protein